MTMPRCSFLASPPRNRARAARLCASVSTGYQHCCESYWTIGLSFATNGLDAHVAKHAFDCTQFGALSAGVPERSWRDFKKKRLGPRPQPLHVSKYLARSELLAPFLFLGWFLRFFCRFLWFWLGLGFFGLCFGFLFRSSFLGRFSRGLGGSFGCRRRCYGLFLGDEDLFLLGLHDLIAA